MGRHLELTDGTLLHINSLRDVIPHIYKPGGSTYGTLTVYRTGDKYKSFTYKTQQEFERDHQILKDELVKRD